MKIAHSIARVLLGLLFVVFGANGFLHFIPQPPPPPGLAGQFLGALAGSGYMVPVFALQLVAGVLFLAGRYVPLALTIIAPVIVNILLFHALMAPAGIAPGVVVALLWLVVWFGNRGAFAALFQAKSPEVSAV
jgi:putative oxidoreductase